MKHLLFTFMLVITTIILVGCNDDNRPEVINLKIVAELPIYCMENIKPGLIDESEAKSKLLILNSKEDVINNIREDFLNEYPEYLDIDFSKHSLFVRTSIIDYKILKRKISYYWKKENDQERYIYKVDYNVGDQFPEDEYYI